MTTQPALPLSVLDLAVVNSSETSADALANTARLAKHAEALGYKRFWVAEHHNAPFVASTVPAVLIAHLAAITERIQVGSGGVMLTNHAPLAVAEQFAMLEALHPRRINLGIGRAPGTDGGTAGLLRPIGAMEAVERFPESVVEVMGLMGYPFDQRGVWDRFSATPNPTSVPTVFLLGSSDYSATLAGQLGLPFAFANHFDNGGTHVALEAYREHFKPSDLLEKPYAIVTASVLMAESDAQAQFLAAPGMLMTYGIRTGRFIPLMPPEEAAKHPDSAAARAMRSNRIVGSPQTALAHMQALARATQADEIMISGWAHGLEDRLNNLTLIAQAWFGAQGAT